MNLYYKPVIENKNMTELISLIYQTILKDKKENIFTLIGVNVAFDKIISAKEFYVLRIYKYVKYGIRKMWFLEVKTLYYYGLHGYD